MIVRELQMHSDVVNLLLLLPVYYNKLAHDPARIIYKLETRCTVTSVHQLCTMKMNVRLYVTLGLAATVLVIQSVNGQEGSSTASTTTDSNGSTAAPPANTTSAAQCGGTDGGLVALLTQVGNLLGNILGNIPVLGQLLSTNPGGLLDLAGLIVQVQRLLNNLLVSLQLGNLNLTEENGRVANLLAQIRTLLNDLLGGSQGDKWACQNSGGSTGGPLGELVNGVGTVVTGSDATHNLGLITLVNFLLTLVGSLLSALNVAGLLGGLLPGLHL